MNFGWLVFSAGFVAFQPQETPVFKSTAKIQISCPEKGEMLILVVSFAGFGLLFLVWAVFYPKLYQALELKAV